MNVLETYIFYPMGSKYGISTYIYLIFMVNVQNIYIFFLYIDPSSMYTYKWDLEKYTVHKMTQSSQGISSWSQFPIGPTWSSLSYISLQRNLIKSYRQVHAKNTSPMGSGWKVAQVWHHLGFLRLEAGNHVFIYRFFSLKWDGFLGGFLK